MLKTRGTASPRAAHWESTAATANCHYCHYVALPPISKFKEALALVEAENRVLRGFEEHEGMENRATSHVILWQIVMNNNIAEALDNLVMANQSTCGARRQLSIAAC